MILHVVYCHTKKRVTKAIGFWVYLTSFSGVNKKNLPETSGRFFYLNSVKDLLDNHFFGSDLIVANQPDKVNTGRLGAQVKFI